MNVVETVVDGKKLMLINFRGMVMPMTPEEYRSFIEDLAEWSN